jgi:signal transduction histidine kinase
VAVLISLWLAGGVTDPLQAVTDVARRVIEQRDFTLRARRTTDDEIGVLVDAFNAMLSEVGQRAQKLEDSNRALKQETEERRQAEVALRLADQRKDEFLATLAHELRNPLAPMVNSMELLDLPAADQVTTRRAQGIVRRQLKQMVRLVDDLLDVSSITSGKLVIRKQTVELSTIVKNAVDTARPVLDERKQTLDIDLPSAPIYLHADAVRLSQVFSNLLNNAAKYSEPGKHVALRATMNDDRVSVRIEDQGMGIPPQALAAIFDMFTQGDAAAPTQKPTAR